MKLEGEERLRDQGGMIPSRQSAEKEDRAMPDPIERKRLKKKMLDRWENEGGRIGADSAGADDTRTASEHERKDKQLSASRGNPTVGGPASPTKRRKATRK
jgi:hypothetical protein